MIIRKNNTNVFRRYFSTRPSFIQETKPSANSKYDSIIIGGGHNGLISAFYLAKAGQKVCVLERRHTVGGAAVTEEIIPDFKFSRASYVLGLLRPHIYTDLQLQRHGLKIYSRNPSSYTPIQESFWNDFKAKSLTLGSDRTQNVEQISKFSKQDAIAFEEYENLLNKFICSLTPLLDSHPPDLNRFNQLNSLKKIKYLSKMSPIYKAVKSLGEDSTKLLQMMTSPTSKVLNRWFKSEPLKATLATDSVIGSMTCTQSPGTGYVLLHHVMAETNGIKGAWGFPQGGMGALTHAIGSAATEAGAELYVEQSVREIIVDSDGTARGVRLDTGEELLSDAVLSNATPKVTFQDLIPDGVLPKDFEEEVGAIDYSSPVCKINVAVKNIPNFSADSNPGVVMPHHQCTIHLNCEDMNYIDEAYRDAQRGIIPNRPLIELTVPSSLDPTLAPKGCHVCLLFTQYVPKLLPGQKLSKEETGTYIQKVFDTVEAYTPGFKSSIVGYEALMPWDLEDIFGLTGGNIFHGAMSLDQLYMSRPTSFQAGPETPVRGLYLCGSGAHPGGGVMGAPGYLAAKALLRK